MSSYPSHTQPTATTFYLFFGLFWLVSRALFVNSRNALFFLDIYKSCAKSLYVRRYLRPLLLGKRWLLRTDLSGDFQVFLRNGRFTWTLQVFLNLNSIFLLFFKMYCFFIIPRPNIKHSFYFLCFLQFSMMSYKLCITYLRSIILCHTKLKF